MQRQIRDLPHEHASLPASIYCMWRSKLLPVQALDHMVAEYTTQPWDHPDSKKNSFGVKRPFSELSESSRAYSEQLSESRNCFSEWEIPFSEWNGISRLEQYENHKSRSNSLSDSQNWWAPTWNTFFLCMQAGLDPQSIPSIVSEEPMLKAQNGTDAIASHQASDKTDRERERERARRRGREGERRQGNGGEERRAKRRGRRETCNAHTRTNPHRRALTHPHTHAHQRAHTGTAEHQKREANAQDTDTRTHAHPRAHTHTHKHPHAHAHTHTHTDAHERHNTRTGRRTRTRTHTRTQAHTAPTPPHDAPRNTHDKKRQRARERGEEGEERRRQKEGRKRKHQAGPNQIINVSFDDRAETPP